MYMAFLALMLALLWPNQASGATVQSPSFSQMKIRGNSAGDEFIELYNPLEQGVELSGFKLVKQTSSGTAYTLLTFGQKQILPGSFLLLALDGSSFQGQSDLIYKTALADDNTLLLYDATGGVIDRLAWGAGQDLDNHTPEESFQREWQSAASSWSAWKGAAFTQARRSGDAWLSPNNDVANNETLVPPCVIVAPQETATPSVTPPAEPIVSAPPAPVVAKTGRVFINEVFANPEGDETSQEFIELVNLESYPIDLSGWSIADASKSHVLGELSIESQDYLVLYKTQTTLSLNNTDESLRLTDSTGQLIASFTYAKTAEGLSWNRTDAGEWYEAAPSAGETNIALVSSDHTTSESEPTIPVETPPTPDTLTPTVEEPVQATQEVAPDEASSASDTLEQATAAAKQPKAKTKPITEVTFGGWDKVKAKTTVQITGLLTVLPGTFSDKTALLESVGPSTPGIELYFSKAEWPDLDIGDILTITGKKSETKQGRRLLIAQTSDIEIVDHVDFEPPLLEIENLSAKDHNRVVQIEAHVVPGKSGLFTLTQDIQELTASSKNARFTLDFEDGLSDAVVTGVYKHKEKSELWLRDEDDYELSETDEPVLVELKVTDDQIPTTITAATPNHDPAAPWFAPFAAASSAGGLTWYFFQDQLRQNGLKLWQKFRKP